MTDSKFYRFLQELELKELRRFRKYLESPYFNTHPKILRLFEIFETHLLHGEGTKLDKELIWNNLFPNENFDYGLLRKLQHRLMELGYSFLAQQIYDSNLATKSNNLLQMLAIKQVDDYLPQFIKTGVQNVNHQQNRNGQFYYDLYSVEKYKYILANVESTRVQKSNIQKLNLDAIDDNLNIFYISEKLRNYCLILSWSKMIEVKLEIALIDEIIEIIHVKNYLNYPSIAVYFQIYKTFIEPDVFDNFYELKKLIREHLHLFPANEARDIVNSAINYTIQKINAGIQTFAQDNFELWNQALVSKVILINNEISPWAFKNIITIALGLNKINWTENFINEYGNKIFEPFKENALNYNRAVLHFYKKEYKHAIPYLQKVQFDEVTYGLGARTLLLESYYEMDEFDALASLLDSFKGFIKRTKSITSEIKKRYLLLIKYTSNLAESANSKTKLITLKADINKSNAISKGWLIQKVDELLN